MEASRKRVALLSGMGSILEISPPARADFASMEPPLSDAEALADDWNATGNDLGRAVNFHIKAHTKMEQRVTLEPQAKLW
jgi:hypothetical protein